MRILATLPFVADWIQKNKQLTEKDFETLKRLYPEQYEFAENISFEELIELNTRYRDSAMYGKQIEILLSPQGIQWLSNNFEKLKELKQKSQ